MATVQVALSARNFQKGLSYAKRVGGTYDPQTKTWAIPAERPELGAAAAYGWVLVAPAQTAAAPAVDASFVAATAARIRSLDAGARAQFVRNLEALCDLGQTRTFPDGTILTPETAAAILEALR